jgi:small subunit ribosomal protein S9
MTADSIITEVTETAPTNAGSKDAFTWGLGRRKSSIARVRVTAGTGNFIVNGKPLTDFFCTLQGQKRAIAPLLTAESEGNYDIFCNVKGGGITGQADAVRLGLARALRKINMAWDLPFREEGLLTRDARMVERKKYGRRGARRGFQFSKR